VRAPVAVVGQGAVGAAADEQAELARAGGVVADPRPVVVAVAFGSGAGRYPIPLTHLPAVGSEMPSAPPRADASMARWREPEVARHVIC